MKKLFIGGGGNERYAKLEGKAFKVVSAGGDLLGINIWMRGMQNSKVRPLKWYLPEGTYSIFNINLYVKSIIKMKKSQPSRAGSCWNGNLILNERYAKLDSSVIKVALDEGTYSILNFLYFKSINFYDMRTLKSIFCQ